MDRILQRFTWQGKLAVLLLVGHIVAVGAFGPGARGVLVSDCFLLPVAILTALSCFITSRRCLGFSKSFWFVLAAAFVIWSVGQAIQIRLDLTVRSWPIVETLLFFFSITIIFLVVFGLTNDTDGNGIRWAWVLDAVQILVLVLALYLYLIYVPTLLYGGRVMGPLRLQMLHMRNVLLVGGLIVRAIGSRTIDGRRLFAPLAFALALYTFGSYLANRSDFLYGESASPWWGLAWSVPFTFITIHAVLWDDPSPETSSQPQSGGITTVLLVYLPSLAIPVLMLAMYSKVVKEQVIIGLIALMISTICYSLRLALLNGQKQQTLDALRISEQRHRSLFDSNVAGVFRCTQDGRVLECNRRFCEMFGYTRAELLALPPWLLNPVRPEEQSALVADRMRSGVPSVFEKNYRRKDGSPIWTLASATAGKDVDGVPYYEGTMLDVTERRRLEDQLFQAQRMEAVGRLAGGIAHDFNNVLTVIAGYSAMLIARSEASDPVHEDAQEIRAASERAAALTRQLLAFSRQQVLQLQVVSLNSILEGIVKMVGRLIGEDIEMSLRCASNLGVVKADPGQIEQILLNLVVNSRDAMPSGGMLTLETANVDLDHEYAAQHPYMTAGPHVMLAVSDTGTGMDAAIRSRIFEPFFTTKEHGKGTGLGLSTVYGIVKQSGGHIEVYSELDKGTTFKIYFPRVEGSIASVEAPARDGQVIGVKGQETVLLVEDDDALRKLAQRALVDRGYRVIATNHPEDAEDLCRQNDRIDLLLTDVVMPGISGREVARRVTNLLPNIRVLYMSGYTTNAIVDHGVLDEGLAFLPKPFTPASLTSKVREILDEVPGRPVAVSR